MSRNSLELVCFQQGVKGGSSAGRVDPSRALPLVGPTPYLDYVVDFLRDNPRALKQCCLVSKSWIPLTRNHLFAEIRLHTEKHLESWKKDAEAGGWLGSFSRVVHLWVRSQASDPELPAVFAPFHSFPPVVNSLRMTSVSLLSSQIFDIPLSIPVLEDLAVSTQFGGLSN